MLEPDQKIKSGEHPRTGRLWLVPVGAAVGAVITFLVARTVSPPEQNWNGMVLRAPIDVPHAVHEDQGEALFETTQSTPVHAGIDGIVSSRSNRELEIQHDSITIVYRGLLSNDLKQGDRVKAGAVIGNLALDHPDPLVAKLWMRVLRDGSDVAPPFSPRFESEGQRAYVMACVGCHQMRKIQVLVGGKFANGELGTPQAIATKIREGGKISAKDGPAMPPFPKEALPDKELQGIIAYLCQSRQCAEPLHHPSRQ